ncbi:hypothetical protein L6164_007734 [Bauhinia variegata]|uniref:Uncharacterized protein n=1 Tax=Bauhinia variegata TaxID=167791 RepID=A0ACB9PEN0_BAUVA|nr:hypothetical protein L6164_007734 [Bauhinia variegata]
MLPPELEELSLDGNSLKGVLTESHFMKLSKLKTLELSYNSLLALRFRTTWIPLFQLNYLGLASCKLGPRFPNWLQTQNSLYRLDISNAGISGSVPEWFWNASIPSINISHNSLVGEIPNLPLELASVSVIDLHSNQFEGVIPSFFSQASLLFLSRNKFSDMVQFLCGNNTYTFLVVLDISNNELGHLPNCWSHLKSLEFIDLSNNKLSGKVPVSMGSLVEMKALVLRNNSLIGELPSSLQNCFELALLDIGENKLSGPLPSWIGESLQQLKLLSLRANGLNGSLPWHLCYLWRIRVLDLSQNNFSKDIPTCIKNFTVIAQKRNDSDEYSHHVSAYNRDAFSYSYDFNILMTWKYVEYILKNPERLFRIIDLSNNNLTGKIPDELGYLVGLISLNLSRNSLSGEINPLIGNLKSLEVLDLSRNHLSGKIPSTLAQLDTLGVLDLSNNRLHGKIPNGRHLQTTFDASSFAGNIDLCGMPLDKICPEDRAPTLLHASPITKEDHEKSDFLKAFFMSMGLGFPIGFWGLLVPILIKRSWRHAFIRLLNKLIDNIYVIY